MRRALLFALRRERSRHRRVIRMSAWPTVGNRLELSAAGASQSNVGGPRPVSAWNVHPRRAARSGSPAKRPARAVPPRRESADEERLVGRRIGTLSRATCARAPRHRRAAGHGDRGAFRTRPAQLPRARDPQEALELEIRKKRSRSRAASSSAAADAGRNGEAGAMGSIAGLFRISEDKFRLGPKWEVISVKVARSTRPRLRMFEK
jgi:hypothetical protein